MQDFRIQWIGIEFILRLSRQAVPLWSLAHKCMTRGESSMQAPWLTKGALMQASEAVSLQQ